jgi:hypothetical protein
MDKTSALLEISRRTGVTLDRRGARFANVNRGKTVWWLDVPLEKIVDMTDPDLHIVLADSNGQVHYLRVPKKWMATNIDAFAIREDKAAISLELSCGSGNLFQDVRPTSGRLDFSRFVR